jgi:hypothetical protein
VFYVSIDNPYAQAMSVIIATAAIQRRHIQITWDRLPKNAIIGGEARMVSYFLLDNQAT